MPAFLAASLERHAATGLVWPLQKKSLEFSLSDSVTFHSVRNARQTLLQNAGDHRLGFSICSFPTGVSAGGQVGEQVPSL